jgi:hippurate hydrolase
VLSICHFTAGNTTNVIPQTAYMAGTIRTLKPRVRELVVRRVHEVCEGVAKQFGVKIDLQHKPGYPVLVNHDEHTDIAARVAADVVGDGNVNTTAPPMMGAEDFAYMLESRPGAFIFVGNGEGAGLHNPAYNFNDEAIVYGTSYWIKLIESTLAAA